LEEEKVREDDVVMEKEEEFSGVVLQVPQDYATLSAALLALQEKSEELVEPDKSVLPTIRLGPGVHDSSTAPLDIDAAPSGVRIVGHSRSKTILRVAHRLQIVNGLPASKFEYDPATRQTKVYVDGGKKAAAKQILLSCAWPKRAERLQTRFPSHSPAVIVACLKSHNGHGGNAAYDLKNLEAETPQSSQPSAPPVAENPQLPIVFENLTLTTLLTGENEVQTVQIHPSLKSYNCIGLCNSVQDGLLLGAADVILLGSGRFVHQQAVTIARSNLRIEGAGCEETTLVGKIEIQGGASDVVLRELCVTNETVLVPTKTGGATKYDLLDPCTGGSGIQVGSWKKPVSRGYGFGSRTRGSAMNGPATLRLERCRIIGCKADGLVVLPRSQCHATDCTIEDNTNNGVHIIAGRCTLANCIIQKNGAYAVLVGDAGFAELSEKTIVRNCGFWALQTYTHTPSSCRSEIRVTSSEVTVAEMDYDRYAKHDMNLAYRTNRVVHVFPPTPTELRNGVVRVPEDRPNVHSALAVVRSSFRSSKGRVGTIQIAAGEFTIPNTIRRIEIPPRARPLLQVDVPVCIVGSTNMDVHRRLVLETSLIGEICIAEGVRGVALQRLCLSRREGRWQTGYGCATVTLMNKAAVLLEGCEVSYMWPRDADLVHGTAEEELVAHGTGIAATGMEAELTLLRCHIHDITQCGVDVGMQSSAHLVDCEINNNLFGFGVQTHTGSIDLWGANKIHHIASAGLSALHGGGATKPAIRLHGETWSMFENGKAGGWHTLRYGDRREVPEKSGYVCMYFCLVHC